MSPRSVPEEARADPLLTHSGETAYAARISSAAAGGEVLVTGQTAILVPNLEGVILESRGRKSLRNVSESVDLFALLRTGESGRGISPSRCVGWQSIPNAHQGSSRTRVRSTSSARSRVQERSRREPRAFRDLSPTLAAHRNRPSRVARTTSMIVRLVVAANRSSSSRASWVAPSAVRWKLFEESCASFA